MKKQTRQWEYSEAGLRRLLVGADGGSINVFGPFCFDHSRLSGGIATFSLKCLYTMGVLGAGPRCLLVAADAASRLSMMKSHRHRIFDGLSCIGHSRLSGGKHQRTIKVVRSGLRWLKVGANTGSTNFMLRHCCFVKFVKMIDLNLSF